MLLPPSQQFNGTPDQNGVFALPIALLWRAYKLRKGWIKLVGNQ